MLWFEAWRRTHQAHFASVSGQALDLAGLSLGISKSLSRLGVFGAPIMRSVVLWRLYIGVSFLGGTTM